MIGSLPKKLEVDGVYYPINSDYRAALIIMQAYNDNRLSEFNKQLTMLEIIYTPLATQNNPNPKPNIPQNANEAIRQALWFLDIGITNKSGDADNKIKTIDYKQDEQLLFSAINAVYTKDVREEKYMHWWTFYGLCQAIDGESLISTIANIRFKKAKGKKLEKHEQDFYRDNAHLVNIKTSELDYDEMVRQLRG